MNKVFSFILLALLLLSYACGSKKSPTGGKLDLEKPELLESLPTEFSDISGGVIELSFSKYLDKTSVTRGLYIYPLIGNKSITVEKNRVIIKIKESLKQDTNYYVTITPRIKDIRGNAVERSRTLVFASGELQTGKLSGLLKYEIEADRGLPVQFDLLSPDSILVFSSTLRGESYAVENLNRSGYLWKAYIDKDLNGRFDLEYDAGDSGRFSLDGFERVDVNLAYSDTSSVKISSVLPISSTEVIVRFSEPVTSLSGVGLSYADGSSIPIIAKSLDKRDLTLVYRAEPGKGLKLIIQDARDQKGNISQVLRTDYINSPKADTQAPQILSSVPRNGTSVSSSQPVISITFSEVVDPASLDIELISADKAKTITTKLDSSHGKTIILRPDIKLTQNKEYQINISGDCADAAGNRLGQEQKLSFLVLGD